MADLTFYQIVEVQTRDGITGILNLAKSLGLCGNIPSCAKCETPMIECRSNDCPDGLIWYCSSNISVSKQKKAKCGNRRSYRKCTFFENTHLQIWQVLGFITLWTKNMPLLQMHKELKIVGEHTLVDFASFCREVLFDAFIANAQPIGGIGRTVQIDESKFGKRKYHRGHRVEGVWVFGGIDTETGEVFLLPVEYRNRECLLAIIKHFILPGTTIISDCWKAYDTLNEEGYIHLKVNHSINFVDPQTGAHTNNIESTWRHAKEIAGTHNRKKDFTAGYLAKYMFLKSCRKRKIDESREFCNLAAKLFNGISEPEENPRKSAWEKLEDDLESIYERCRQNQESHDSSSEDEEI